MTKEKQEMNEEWREVGGEGEGEGEGSDYIFGMTADQFASAIVANELDMELGTYTTDEPGTRGICMLTYGGVSGPPGEATETEARILLPIAALPEIIADLTEGLLVAYNKGLVELDDMLKIRNG